MYEAYLEIPEGWGILEKGSLVRKKSLLWGRYGYVLGLCIIHEIIVGKWDNPICNPQVIPFGDIIKFSCQVSAHSHKLISPAVSNACIWSQIFLISLYTMLSSAKRCFVD